MAEALHRLTARQAVDLLRRREVSPLELIDAAEHRIHEVEGALNALPTLCFARARSHAQQIMTTQASNASAPYLFGLPIVVKDLTAVADVRWTEGSLVFADRVAAPLGYYG